MSLSGIAIANFPNDVLFDAGIVKIGSALLGVTRGPPKFDPARSWENVVFDGKWAPVKGLDRPVNGEPVISFTLLEFGGATTGNQLPKIEPGATAATVGGVTTYTPVAAGAFIAAGSYVSALRICWERGTSGKFAAILFPVALCTKWDVQGQAKGEALINVEFRGRIDLATNVVSDPAYAVELRDALP